MGGNRTHRAIESYSMMISRGTVETTPSKDVIANLPLYSAIINRNVAYHAAFLRFLYFSNAIFPSLMPSFEIKTLSLQCKM